MSSVRRDATNSCSFWMKKEMLNQETFRVSLECIKCGPDMAGSTLPSGYNSAVMRVKRQFTEEVKHRQTEREHTLSLTHGQRYTLREMRVLFEAITDEDLKGQINILEKAFRGTITTAINRELNLLRRNGLCGEELLKNLTRIYHQHSMPGIP